MAKGILTPVIKYPFKAPNIEINIPAEMIFAPVLPNNTTAASEAGFQMLLLHSLALY